MTHGRSDCYSLAFYDPRSQRLLRVSQVNDSIGFAWSRDGRSVIVRRLKPTVGARATYARVTPSGLVRTISAHEVDVNLGPAYRKAINVYERSTGQVYRDHSSPPRVLLNHGGSKAFVFGLQEKFRSTVGQSTAEDPLPPEPPPVPRSVYGYAVVEGDGTVRVKPEELEITFTAVAWVDRARLLVENDGALRILDIASGTLGPPIVRRAGFFLGLSKSDSRQSAR